MAKATKGRIGAAEAKTEPAQAVNTIFRARLIFKSGAVQDFNFTATSSNVFENMRVAYLGYLSSGSPKSGLYPLGPAGMLVVDWRDVSAFHESFN